MKYIITDQGEVRIGSGFHPYLAEGCKGNVIHAGHCNIKVETYGKSIGYSIDSRPEDAHIIRKAITTV